MNSFILFFLVIAFVTNFSVADPLIGGVITLDEKNFDELIYRGKDDWLIDFYINKCKSCKALEPTMEELARRLEGEIRVGKVHCALNKDICERFQISSHPTVHLVRKSRLYRYLYATKDVDTLLKFVSKQPPFVNTVGEVLPDIEEQEFDNSPVYPLGIENFTSIVTNDIGWLINFYSFKHFVSTKFTPLYRRLGRTISRDGVRCGDVNCSNQTLLCDEFNITAFPTVVFTKGGKYWEFKGEQKINLMIDFVQKIVDNDLPEVTYDVPTLWGKYHEHYLNVRFYIEGFEVFVKAHLWKSIAFTFFYGMFLGWYIVGAPIVYTVPPQQYQQYLQQQQKTSQQQQQKPQQQKQQKETPPPKEPSPPKQKQQQQQQQEQGLKQRKKKS